MASFSIKRQPCDINGQTYHVTISTPGMTWSRYLFENDLDELFDRTQQALDGKTPEPMHNWRNDKYPDENLADREAVCFNLTSSTTHPNAWNLVINEYADLTVELRGTDLRELHDAIEKAEEPVFDDLDDDF